MATPCHNLLLMVLWYRLVLDLYPCISTVAANTQYFRIPGNGTECYGRHIPINAAIVSNSNFNETGLVTKCVITFEVDDIKPHDRYSDYNSLMAYATPGLMTDCTVVVEVYTTKLQDYGAYMSFNWSDEPVAVIGCHIDGHEQFLIISGPYLKLEFKKKSKTWQQHFNFNVTITKVKQEQFCAWKDFICHGDTCIDSSNRCDNINHCPDGEDEMGCGDFFSKYWYVVVNHFTYRGLWSIFEIIIIVIILVVLIVMVFNRRKDIQNCYRRMMGRQSQEVCDGSQTPLQAVSSQSAHSYPTNTAAYTDQPEVSQPLNQSGYLPNPKPDNPSTHYTYNTESAYSVRF